MTDKTKDCDGYCQLLEGYRGMVEWLLNDLANRVVNLEIMLKTKNEEIIELKRLVQIYKMLEEAE